MSATVYTKPSCVRRNTTKQALVKAGLTYREVNPAQDAETPETVKAMGYQSAPVVFAEGDHQSGFHFDKTEALTTAARELAAVTV